MGTRSVGRTKNHIRFIVILFLCVVAAAAGICAALFFYRESRAEKRAHISLDDATVIFMDIYRKEYDSIFDNEILGKLKSLHEEYGITVTLYVFGQLDDFTMCDMPVYYKDEFRMNADWLKIGFHSISEDNPAEEDISLREFAREYWKTERAIRTFAGGESLAHVVRLHYWYATGEMTDFLKDQGIIGFLCSDKEEQSYSLDEKQTEKLYRSRDGMLEADGITYYVTDIRLENVNDVETALEERRKDRTIVIFTHAWCFEENYDKLETAIRWLAQEEYLFSDLESLPE